MGPRNPPVTCGFPAQRGGNAELVCFVVVTLDKLLNICLRRLFSPAFWLFSQEGDEMRRFIRIISVRYCDHFRNNQFWEGCCVTLKKVWNIYKYGHNFTSASRILHIWWLYQGLWASAYLGNPHMSGSVSLIRHDADLANSRAAFIWSCVFIG